MRPGKWMIVATLWGLVPACGGGAATGSGSLRIRWTVNGASACPGGSSVTVEVRRGPLSASASAACEAGEVTLADLPAAAGYAIDVILAAAGPPTQEARPLQTSTVAVIAGVTTEVVADIVCGPTFCPPDPCASGAASVVVAIASGSSVPGCERTGECYSPSPARVAAGGTVTWSNDDTSAHTVTAGTPADGPDGSFDSSLFLSGSTYQHRFDQPGVYDYFCLVHPWMTGRIEVVRCD